MAISPAARERRVSGYVAKWYFAPGSRKVEGEREGVSELGRPAASAATRRSRLPKARSAAPLPVDGKALEPTDPQVEPLSTSDVDQHWHQFLGTRPNPLPIGRELS